MGLQTSAWMAAASTADLAARPIRVERLSGYGRQPGPAGEAGATR